MGLRDHDPEEGWSSDGADEESGSNAASDEMACPAVVAAEEVRWDDWEERVEEHRRTRPPSQAARAASTIELCVPLNEPSLTG